MLKIFMTGDNHIGLRYSNHPQKEILIEHRVKAFESMVQKANQEECDLFVITGDLFERTSGISKKTIKLLLSYLSMFHGTVVVLPGNHDYYDESVSVWQDFKAGMDACDNVMLLTEFQPYEISVRDEKVVLYPALCTSLHSLPGENNLEWIRQEEIKPDNTYRIGIAHGAVSGETIDNEGVYFLMERQELEDIPVDAWLIGHTHVPFPKNLTESFTNSGSVFNAGTHVQTDVSCNTEGQCFIIQIDSNKKIQAKKYVPSTLRFCRKQINLTAGNMEAQLDQVLNSLGNDTVVDLNLEGAVTIEEYENRHRILEEKLARFLESSYHDGNLSKLISQELIVTEFPETSFSAGLLNALLEEPKEAQLVYELLTSLKEGK